MGFGEYGEAHNLPGIARIFNVNRYYGIDAEEGESLSDEASQIIDSA